MSKELVEALKYLEREKNVEPEVIIEALQTALLAAYNKYYQNVDANIRIDIDTKVGKISVIAEKEVKKGGKKITEEIEITPSDFGRIAAQTAKQVILQRIKEAERDKLFHEYSGKEGDIVTGIIQQTDQRFTLLDLGKTEALIPPSEQVRSEQYKHGSRIKAYIVEVRKTAREPQIIVSRTHPSLIRKLFELEVPEIQDGVVEVKAVSREPGYRSKIAVHSNDKNVDPVGACVGAKGSRVKMIVHELRGEKIDIIEWNEDFKKFVANSLSPAKVKEVIIDEENHTAEVVVPDDQLSLAIGKEGQNVRLAAKLTGWRIDIKSETQHMGGKHPEEKKDKDKCEALTKSGTRCKKNALEGEKFCKVHLKSTEKQDDK